MPSEKGNCDPRNEHLLRVLYNHSMNWFAFVENGDEFSEDHLDKLL